MQYSFEMCSFNIKERFTQSTDCSPMMIQCTKYYDLYLTVYTDIHCISDMSGKKDQKFITCEVGKSWLVTLSLSIYV